MAIPNGNPLSADTGTASKTAEPTSSAIAARLKKLGAKDIQPLEIFRRVVLIGKRDLDQIDRRKICRLAKKSPPATRPRGFRLSCQNRPYFRTINVNG